MTNIWGEERKVSEMKRTAHTGVRCDVCGKEISVGKDYPGWGVPKGWYRIDSYTGYATDVSYADACGIEHLQEIARDIGRYLKGEGVRIYGDWHEIQKQ